MYVDRPGEPVVEQRDSDDEPIEEIFFDAL
jgi:hypothetical protein